ncbi:MAG: hypothetical protein PHT12_03105 [Patescibacteria group bacterium]|nr:hypothetical protein [Patescibacteria group bacterium]
MTRKDKEIFKDFMSPPAPPTGEPKPWTNDDTKKFIKAAKAIRPIIEKAEREGRFCGGH